MANTTIPSELIQADVALGGSPTTTTQSAGNNTTKLATTAFVTTAVNNLIASAPGTMDTLNEIAAALNDDPDFTTTVNNAIATKLPLSGGTMTGNIAHASDFTLDIGGDIILDADGGDIYLNDGGTGRGQISMANTDLTIISATSDRDLIFKGVDGGSVITALTLDMSAAGAANFNSSVTVGTNLQLNANDSYVGFVSNGIYYNNSADHISVKTAATERMRIDSSGNVGIGTGSVTNNTNRTTLGLQGAWGGQLDIMVGSTVHAQFGTDNFSSGQSCRIQSQDGIMFRVANSLNSLFLDSNGTITQTTSSASPVSANFVTGNSNCDITMNSANTSSLTRLRNGTNDFQIHTNGAERMRIESDGQVQVSNAGGVRIDAVRGSRFGYSSAYRCLVLGGSGVTTSDNTAIGYDPTTNSSGSFTGYGESIYFRNNVTLRTPNTANDGFHSYITMKDANVGIGVIPTTKLHIGDNDHLGFGTGSATKPDFRISYVSASNSLGIKCGTGGEGVDVTLTPTADLTIAGALSKGSGSFKIDHPLESKKDTHHLVHSFVEAPQADNIYRGKVDLVDGSATVNIDTVAGMTEGTFIALNTNVQCFTSNETDWDAVKGSVSENILTISCQNTSSTATVSWLVIGERQDQHMLDTYWTDESGKVIVEPTK